MFRPPKRQACIAIRHPNVPAAGHPERRTARSTALLEGEGCDWGSSRAVARRSQGM